MLLPVLFPGKWKNWEKVYHLHEIFFLCIGVSLHIFLDLCQLWLLLIAQIFQLGMTNWSVGMRLKFLTALKKERVVHVTATVCANGIYLK